MADHVLMDIMSGLEMSGKISGKMSRGDSCVGDVWVVRYPIALG